MNQIEEWKKVEKFPNYSVSNMGRIRNDKTNKMMKLHKANGYYKVDLRGNEKKQLRVHRLVATAFIPNPRNKPQVNHKDGNRSNNNVDNLEWCTNQENILHSYRVLGRYSWIKGKHHTEMTKEKIGVSNKGKRHTEEAKQKMSDNNTVKRKVRRIEDGKIYNSIVEAKKDNNIKCSSAIVNACKGLSKKCGGYHWEYVKEA